MKIISIDLDVLNADEFLNRIVYLLKSRSEMLDHINDFLDYSCPRHYLSSFQESGDTGLGGRVPINIDTQLVELSHRVFNLTTKFFLIVVVNFEDFAMAILDDYLVLQELLYTLTDLLRIDFEHSDELLNPHGPNRLRDVYYYACLQLREIMCDTVDGHNTITQIIYPY